MRLHIRHRTRYHYATEARDSFNEVRLAPVNDELQRRISFSLKTDPREGFSQYLDFYGNLVHYFEIGGPHRTLSIESVAIVETAPDPRGVVPSGQPLSAMANHSAQENLHDFLRDSKYITLTPEIWRAALDVVTSPIEDVWAAANALSHWVFTNFYYEPGATLVTTTMSEALSMRRGVCQDFAHVLCGLCRSLKIPARYVSGYFLDEERTLAPGESEASHAWVEVYVPSFGWAGLDPTHDRPTDERYIKVATGRDYADIRPVAGTYRGSTAREMEIFVRVSRG